jgi:hypothetical protein
MEELRHEREGTQAAESDLQRELPINRARTARWQPSEMDAGCGGSANPAQAAVRSRAALMRSA